MIGLAQPLRAGLVDAAVAAGGLDYGAALGDRHAGRFFGVNVLARPHGQDRGQGVPMVSRSDKHGVDVGPVRQETVDFRVHGGVAGPVVGVDKAFDVQPLGFLQVADGDEADFWQAHDPIQIAQAAVLDADASHEDLITGRHGSIFAEHACWNDRWQGEHRARLGRGLEQFTSCKFFMSQVFSWRRGWLGRVGTSLNPRAKVIQWPTAVNGASKESTLRWRLSSTSPAIVNSSIWQIHDSLDFTWPPSQNCARAVKIRWFRRGPGPERHPRCFSPRRGNNAIQPAYSPS